MEQILQEIMPFTEEAEGKKGKKSPAFIAYKEGHKGQHNPGIEVKLSSDDLFRILFGPHSKVGEISRQKAGSKDYWESLWYPTETEAFNSLRQHAKNFTALQSGSLVPVTSAAPSGILEMTGPKLKGRTRVNVCHCRQLGREAYSFERERCLEASKGGTYLLEICVRSTALSAERFRVVFLHKIEATGPLSSRWSVTYDIFFVEKTNFIIKGTIEAGANSAIRKNTETMQKTVKECADQYGFAETDD